MEDMINKAKKFIEMSSMESSVYIGCDSQAFRDKKTKKWFARYSTVVVVHKDSNRGCKLFYDTTVEPVYHTIQRGKGAKKTVDRMRLMNEVYKAGEVANALIDTIGDRPFEIHLDINPDPKHGSSIVVKEALGYVRSMFGFDPKLKPESHAATHCADHLAKNKDSKLRRTLKIGQAA